MTKKCTCVRIGLNLVYCRFMNEIHIQILPSVSILFYETISLEECIFAVSMTIVWLSSTYSISKILKKKIDVIKKTCFVHSSRSLKLNHLTKFLTSSSGMQKFEQRFTKFPIVTFLAVFLSDCVKRCRNNIKIFTKPFFLVCDNVRTRYRTLRVP